MASDLIVPDAAILVREFIGRHHLQVTDIVEYERLPIRASSAANILVNAGYARLSDDALSDPVVGLLLNLLHRNFELVEATIVAFVTGCGSAAEVVSRASIESSVNIAFIAIGEPNDRLRAYFDHYLQGVDRQVRTWKDQASTLSGRAAELHEKGIARRQNANDVLRGFVEKSMSPAKNSWPKSIDQRFKELRSPLDYRTFYARMSSEVHADAEETLRYLLGTLSGDEKILEAMALETVWTQRLYINYALSWFLKASIIYSARYNMMEVVKLLQQDFIDVETEINEIALHVGSGLESE